MRNSCDSCPKYSRFFLLGTLPFLAILALVILDTSVNAFAENPYDDAIMTNILEDSWNRKAQAMIKIFTTEDDKRILLVENFVTNSDRSLVVYFASENDFEKRVRLGEIDPNKVNQFYTIPKEVNFSEYNTILVIEDPYSIVYGRAMIV